MQRRLFVLLSLVGVVFAATHLNISIAQHPLTSPADVTYIDGKASADIKAGPAETNAFVKQYDGSRRNTDAEYFRRLHKSESSARLEAPRIGGISGHRSPALVFDTQQEQRKFEQLKQAKQNHEFERYIQNYHNGPTVETLYESANGAPQRYEQFSGVSTSNSFSPQRKDTFGSTFERQVALPIKTEQSTAEDDGNQRKQIADKNQYIPGIDSTSNPLPVSSLSASSNSDVAYDQSNLEAPTSYNTQSNSDGEAVNHNFDDIYQSGLHNTQLPADDFQDGNIAYGQNNDQAGAYIPVPSGSLPSRPLYQNRPTVTKTIQIAQPALKAKKYEVRHPAIQKEFYDIEERVIIRPAGTIVVELERPVAKIPRGETILPLGHPHPAVAGAYNLPQSTYAESPRSSGSDSGNYLPRPVPQNVQSQYNPGFNYASQKSESVGSSTIASTITTTPTYNQGSKDVYLEAKQLNPENGPKYREFSGENSFIITDSQGNQRRISSKDITPNMLTRDETDSRPSTDRGQDQQRQYINNADNSDGDFKRTYNNNLPNRSNQRQYNDNNFGAEVKHRGTVSSQPDAVESDLPDALDRVKERPRQVQRVQYSAPYSQMRYVPNESTHYADKPAPLTDSPTRGKYANLVVEELNRVPAESAESSFDFENVSKQQHRQGPANSRPHAHIQIHIPQHPQEADKPIVISSTISPIANHKLKEATVANQADKNELNNHHSSLVGLLQRGSECDHSPSAHNEQKFSRLVEPPKEPTNENVGFQQPTAGFSAENVNVIAKGTIGHMAPHGSRVIAATPAPTDASAHRESFHKRRIVVNHPFQTVREVVEHEPITNYHEIQVTEPASPGTYHSAPYFQHESRQFDVAVPENLQYSSSRVAIPHYD